jgi:hypothetical protein
MERIFGMSTLVLCLAAAFIGVPSLIIKYYREKRCGMTLVNILIVLGMLISRTTYALTIGANYIAFPDALGVVLFLILLWQYFIYHPKRLGEF